jgi:hypothetical protein
MSNNLNLSQVAENQNQKFQTINDKGGELDAAITEQFEADVSAGNVALTAAQYRRAIYIKATGAATSGRTVTLQAIKRLVAIANTSTTDSVGFILGTATVTLAAAASATEPTIAVVYTDGTANGLYVVTGSTGGGVVAAFTDLSDVPGAYTGHGLKGLRVNNGATAIEFVTLALTLLSDFPASFSGQGGKELVVNAGGTAVEFVARPYDFGFVFGETPDADAVVGRVMIPRSMTLPANFAGSVGYVGTNPTATFDVDVKDDGSSIGTISISDSGVFTFTTTSGTAKTVAAGSRIEFVAPGTPDATIEDVSVTLVGSLN